MKIIDGLKYSKDHEWVKSEDNKAYIGITDYAQQALGDIVYVELPEAGSKIGKGDPFGVVESVKAACDIYLPVSGTVTEANDAIADDPELLNKDAFENWMIRVEMDNSEELEQLMDAKEYETFCSDQ